MLNLWLISCNFVFSDKLVPASTLVTLCIFVNLPIFTRMYLEIETLSL